VISRGPTDERVERARSAPVESDRTRDRALHISFSEVARAHYRWDVEEDKHAAASEEARKAFEDALARFEGQAEGRVVEDYWCQKQASGVALVQIESGPAGRSRRVLKWLRLWYPVPEYRLYRETDWVTVDLPKLANLLHDCDVLAIKARWGLEGIHLAVVIPWLMAVEAHILGFIERDYRRREALRGVSASSATVLPPEVVEPQTDADKARRERQEAEREKNAERFYADRLRELNRIEDYYQQAGAKRARLHFVTGMVIFGIPVVALAALVSAGALAVFSLLDLEAPGVRRFYACMAAGAIGAIVSVLIRMSGRRGGFTIDHELGSAGVRRLGAFRPLIGAVSGVVISLLVQTTLVPIKQGTLTIEFYVIVAFLAGFSERWTKVVLEGAMRTIGNAEEEGTGPGGSRPGSGARHPDT
jgi:hypothetical protein